MKICTTLFALASFGAMYTQAARADVLIYETATIRGREDSGGTVVGTDGSDLLYQASVFSITNSTHVTAVGGHFGVTPNTALPTMLDAEIVKLPNGSTAPPPNTTGPFNFSDVAAHTTFGLATHLDNGDVKIPLDVTLAPGTYALMFGSGMYGTNGTAYMPTNDIPNPLNPKPVYFWYTANHNWGLGYSSPAGLRFTIYAVPEPSALFLIAPAMLLTRRMGRKSVRRK